MPPGSSPLTRGKLRGHGEELANVGLNPAHAGKTPTYGGTTSQPQAHPRSRGENDRVNLKMLETDGSSPLMRGKHNEDAIRR